MIRKRILIILTILLLKFAYAKDNQDFVTAQKSKAPLFLQRIAGGARDYRRGADSAVVARERELLLKLGNLRADRLYGHSDGSVPRLSGYPDEDTEMLYDQWKILEDRIKLTSPLPAQEPVAYPSIGDIRRIIPHNGVLLDFYIGTDKSFVFVLDRKDFRAVRLDINRVQLEKFVDSYIEAMEKNEDEKIINARGQGLAQKLGIADIAVDYTQKEIMIIAPHSFLHRLPFNTLTLSSGSRLIEVFDVVQTPSATAYYMMKKRNGDKMPGQGAVLFDLHPEEGDREESNLYSFTSILSGSAFTRESFFASAPGAETVHIRDPYSIINNSYPEFSQFFAWRQGIYYFQVADHYYRPSVMVLDFPESTRGFMTPGDDIFSFARAFLAGGADRVIAHGGKDKMGSIRLWREYYRSIKQGHNPHKAYRNAVLEIIENSKPSNWNDYVLYGID